jgi:hypothetical protein
MKEYQRAVVNSISLESFALRLQSTGTDAEQAEPVVCNGAVNCTDQDGDGFTSGFCITDFAGGDFFLPGSKPEDEPHCSITFNGVTAQDCQVNFDRDNSCSDGSFWFIDCQADYNCPEFPQDQQITIHCDGYVDGTCEQEN